MGSAFGRTLYLNLLINLFINLLETNIRSKLCEIEDPEIRGYALGNLPEMAMKHNKFACYEDN